MSFLDLKTEFAITIPYDKPDKNGVVFSKQAVEQAVTDFETSLPIIYIDNDKCPDGVVIGNVVGETTSVLWDDELQICEVIFKGNIYYGGANCIVKEIEDGVVKSLSIHSIGLSR